MKWSGTKSLALCLACGLGVVVVGCAKVEMKQINPTEGIPADDVAKITEHLKAAGIDGKVLKIEDTQEAWIAMVSTQKPAEPGKRASPSPPTSYKIDKLSGQVESAMGPDAL